MTKITCDVVKDLIPLYIDDALSNDSKLLVKEHLQTCKLCNDLHDAMKEDFLHSTTSEKREENVIKKIRKRINVNRFIIAISSACIVALLCGAIFYGVCIRESYIPYVESEIYVEDGILKSDNNYYKFYGYEMSENEKELFIYLSTTPYKKIMFSQNDTTEILHIANETPEQCNRIYYLPEKYAKEFHNDKSSIANENIDEVVKESTLIWEDSGI